MLRQGECSPQTHALGPIDEWCNSGCDEREAGGPLLCTALLVLPTSEGHESSLPVHRGYDMEGA